MKAVVLTNPAPLSARPLAVTDRAELRPGPGEIVIDVAACGVCRSNLHMVEGDWVDGGVPAFTPIVPGHEVTGTVSAVAPDVTHLRVGDRVGVQPLWSTCGVCRYCRSGAEQLCQSKHITGETVDGGYAEQMLAKAAHAYPLPDALDVAEAAPLFCPGITAYGAVAKARLTPAKSVAVFGIGGVGHMALQFAKLTGAETVAVTRGGSRQSLSEELGADRVVDASGGDAGEVLHKAGGVDATLVFAPSDDAVRQAVQATKPGGIIVIGVHANIGAVPFPEEKTVVGSLLGSRQMMREVLEIAATGRVRVVADALPLDRAADALARLKRGEVRGRLVLLPRA
ncbi:alcohol dehydrogenase catalytic domain-containing protein [Planosporangium thailandense]|uniref:alcohol dehydrogenase n=1 Tax=Planosporangium thailandense TaxID=765197 RepID=A0ABX0XRJ3_9ACTN|nr:alcohol dehydrogenase catalytic domain-containing protein [Planosporangium thailandense]NJC68631.1 alcohol dehydrogenase catalytic domain-containing protein [Planosporangium thailandense]